MISRDTFIHLYRVDLARPSLPCSPNPKWKETAFDCMENHIAKTVNCSFPWQMTRVTRLSQAVMKMARAADIEDGEGERTINSRLCSSHNETLEAIMQSVMTGGGSQERIHALTGCYSSCEYAKYEAMQKVGMILLYV